jgi:ribonuclease VapC
MVIDASAVIAILLAEPERAPFSEAIAADRIRLISVVGFVEASFVMLSRKREPGLADLRTFLGDGDIERVPIDERQAEMAVEAFRRFGKGRHPAALNIGDCFAYALAKATGEKLLFKGGDFGQTDVTPALPGRASGP